MGDLTPQLRTDRNGKLVTRHVKTSEAPKQSRRGFAAPTIKRQEPAAPEMSQQDIERERPLKKVKKRKVSTKGVDIASLRMPDRSIPAGNVDMSDEEIYKYLKAGVNLQEAVGLHSIGVEFHQVQQEPERTAGEPDGQYSNRLHLLRQELNAAHKRRERYSDAAHRMENHQIPADLASKALDNGVTLKALDSYLEPEKVAALYAKTTYTKKNEGTVDDLVNGVIPFEQFEAFGINTLNTWRKKVPAHREQSVEFLQRVNDKSTDPTPSIENAQYSREALLKDAINDERILDLRLPELMKNVYRVSPRTPFDYEEAKAVDDFIHEVREKGISDLYESPAQYVKGLHDAYPNFSTNQENRYDCAQILDWHQAGLTNEQIIQGLQNRWNKEQTIAVYQESTPSSLAGGIL